MSTIEKGASGGVYQTLCIKHKTADIKYFTLCYDDELTVCFSAVQVKKKKKNINVNAVMYFSYIVLEQQQINIFTS